MPQSINAERLILVTGATGNQGSAIARHLLQRGNFKVRALVRDPNKPASLALEQAGAELYSKRFNFRSRTHEIKAYQSASSRHRWRF